MPIKKSELYSSLWKSCDELRGGMDASQYKDYVLVLLFLKYVSDKAASNKNYLLDVPKGARFIDLVALKGDKDIGDKMNKLIAKLAGPNELKEVIDVADWNHPEKLGSGKEMVDRLSKLIGIFEGLDFRGNRADGDDLLGDAYEYLMRHFATESGKSKGQFYTPSEVSRVIAQVLGLSGAKSNKATIHDPTCGSGSLLLKAHDEAKATTGFDLALYGQEKDNPTKALAKMNLILHDCLTGEIYPGNTLAAPHYVDAKAGTLKTFDYVVANPPFSDKGWTSGVDLANDEFGRFALGVPPEKNGDYAFLLHILCCLKSTGKGAVILPHGVLFRGNTEAEIRKQVLKRGYIKGIIGLPANLFYGTGIPACILVVDKESAAARKGIFMIDASKGFIKDGNKNRLRSQDIHKIVDTFTKQLEIPRYSRMVPLAEISDDKNAYNLNLPRYIDSSEPEDIQDIDAHLRGGIPNADIDGLSRYWDVFPSVRKALFKKGDRPGYAALKCAPSEIKNIIFSHAEFTAWNEACSALLAKWRKKHASKLRGIALGDRPRERGETLSEDLLAAFAKAPLLDSYDVYQHFMDYWAETMQDDVFMVASVGWLEGAKPREIVQVKDEKGKKKWPEPHDFVVGKRRYKSDLVPAAVLSQRYFNNEKEKVESQQAALSTLDAELAALIDEHCGEEGLLEDATEREGDKVQFTVKSVTKRRKQITAGNADAEERQALDDALDLFKKKADAKSALKEAASTLDTAIATKHAKLTEKDVQQLVVDDKWFATIEAAIQGELDRVSQTLTGRVTELAERYASRLPELASEVEAASSKVEAHLKKMGFSW